MKRNNFKFNIGRNAKKGSELDNEIFEFVEKNDNPQYLFDCLERKRNKGNSANTGASKKSNNRRNDVKSDVQPSSISSAITHVAVTVATVAVVAVGAVPGLDVVKGIDLFHRQENKNTSVNIISIEKTNNDVAYSINLDFNTDSDEEFTLEEKNVAVSLSNDFANYEQIMKYNNSGPTEQGYAIEASDNSKVSSKYTIKQVSEEEEENKEEGSARHSFTVNGSFEGLNQNMNYTFTVKSKGKVLARKSFNTKSDKEILALESSNTGMKIDAYKDIASFEIVVNTENIGDGSSFDDQEFVLRLSNNQNNVDFDLSTTHNYMIKQDIELIYNISQKKTGTGATVYTIRGDLSNLAKNSDYNLTILRHKDKITESSFKTGTH